eukprot:Selendium_serpulae@DN6169_c2_g2_i14.p1
MHDTYLNVFVDDPNFVEAEQAAEDDAEAASVKGRRRRLQGGAEGTEDPEEAEQDTNVVVPPKGELFLGTLFIPEMQMSGLVTPMHITQEFKFSSQEAFDAFAVRLIKDGSSAWHVKGLTVVTVLGKQVNDLNFDKTMPIAGPNFAKPKKDENEDGTENEEGTDDKSGGVEGELEEDEDDGFVAPEVTGLSATPAGLGTYDVAVNLTITNPGMASMDPLGAVEFEVTWTGLKLGSLGTDVISLHPDENDLEMFGVWNLNKNLEGLGFFKSVEMLKRMNDLRKQFKEGKTILLKAKGVSCSEPLYLAAVQAIDAEFLLEGFVLDLMDRGDDDEKEEPEVEVEPEDEVEPEEDGLKNSEQFAPSVADEATVYVEPQELPPIPEQVLPPITEQVLPPITEQVLPPI